MPADLAGYSQLLDLSMNKLFKSALNQKYIKYCIGKSEYYQKIPI